MGKSTGVRSNFLSVGFTSVEQEKSTGDFSAGPPTNEKGGSWVMIENYLEQACNKHLR